MATFKAVVLKGKNQVKLDGTSQIKIRITHQRKPDYIPTDLYVPIKTMNKDSGWVQSGENMDFVNSRISNLLSKYRDKYMELRDRSEYMTVKQVKEYLLSNKSSSSQIDFFDFVSMYIVTTNRKKGTTEQYFATVNSLKNFIGQKLPVSEITVHFLYRYEAWMRGNGVRSGITNYMTTFRSLFNKCKDHYNNEEISQVLIPHYPFKKYKIPERTSTSKKKVLSASEIVLLRNYKTENAGEQFARDMFLLMFYLIGIEAKDLFYLRKPINGRVNYTRFKTEKPFSIKLEPEAIEIIERYEGKELLLNVSERFNFHKSFYRYINNYMSGENAHNIKGIFPDRLKVKKHPTSKWARHTWATIARNKCRIHYDDIAMSLGHDMENMVTDIYIDDDYTIIDESNRKVIDLIHNK